MKITGLRYWASIAVLCLAPIAVGAEDGGPHFSLSSPRFAVDLTPRLQIDGKSSVEVAIQIPYTQLQFVRIKAGYGAGVEFVLVIRNEKGKTMGGDFWEDRFAVASFADSKAPTTAVSVRRRFELEPGKYEIRVQVRDINARRESIVESPFEIRGLGGGSMGMADPEFGVCFIDSNGVEQFEKSLTRRYQAELTDFCMRCRIYETLELDSSAVYQLKYKVKDRDSRTVLQEEITIAAFSIDEFFLRPDITTLFLGEYRVEIEAKEAKRKDKVYGTFTIESLALPRGEQWDVILEALGFLIAREDLDSLHNATSEEDRETAWKAFWAARDPSPETPQNEALLEFMGRIRYSNATFRGFGPGWKTDQGRVYIQHGRPDEIENRAPTDRNPPLQVWHYYDLRQEYIFADRDGFGRFDLLNVVHR